MNLGFTLTSTSAKILNSFAECDVLKSVAPFTLPRPAGEPVFFLWQETNRLAVGILAGVFEGRTIVIYQVGRRILVGVTCGLLAIGI